MVTKIRKRPSTSKDNYISLVDKVISVIRLG